MKARWSTLAALVVAGGASVAIAAAPVALANPLLPSCEGTGGSSVIGGQTTECASPGNVEIDSTPPEPGYGMFPWDDEYWIL